MGRVYPASPVVAVSALVRRGSAVLLVQRGSEPGRGQWSVPGGVLELGETLHDGLRREVREETGLVVEPGELLGVFDHIVRDAEGRVRYHYVLVDYRARPSAGSAGAASDVAAVAWVDLETALATYDLTAGARLLLKAEAARDEGGST